MKPENDHIDERSTCRTTTSRRPSKFRVRSTLAETASAPRHLPVGLRVRVGYSTSPSSSSRRSTRGPSRSEAKTYAAAFRHHRLLVAADSFFEWDRTDPKKKYRTFSLDVTASRRHWRAFRLHLASRTSHGERWVATCTILTTAANDDMPIRIVCRSSLRRMSGNVGSIPTCKTSTTRSDHPGRGPAACSTTNRWTAKSARSKTMTCRASSRSSLDQGRFSSGAGNLTPRDKPRCFDLPDNFIPQAS